MIAVTAAGGGCSYPKTMNALTHAVTATHEKQGNTVQPVDLLALARFEDPKERAVSFYLSSASISDKIHRPELIAIKQLGRDIINSHFDQYPRSNLLLADLDSVLESAEGMADGSSGFKAIFACREHQIWKEFDLPRHSDIRFLKTGKRFHLIPLLRAMESCRPYCVVLLEHGKARGFVVHGTLIREIFGCLPIQDLHLHTVDGRTGWSHHVEADRQEHDLVYLRGLSREIQKFMTAQSCTDLVIGCRKDLWSEIEPHLGHGHSALRGQFHLPSFDASAAEVLPGAKPVFEAHQNARHDYLLGLLRADSRRGALGIQAVQEKIEEGRIQTLLLGPQSDAMILECGSCGYLPMDSVNYCSVCKKTDFAAVNAQEAFARKALLTGAEIAFVDHLGISAPGEVAAILRY